MKLLRLEIAEPFQWETDEVWMAVKQQIEPVLEKARKG